MKASLGQKAMILSILSNEMLKHPRRAVNRNLNAVVLSWSTTSFQNLGSRGISATTPRIGRIGANPFALSIQLNVFKRPT